MSTVTNTPAGWSARSFLVAGISTAVVGAAVLTPGVAPGTLTDPIRIAVPAVNLTAVGDVIINTYDAFEPWVAYGFELADWALSFVPGLWWIAPAIDLAYFTAEPLVQSLVYSFAYLIDGNFDLIGPTLADGLTSAAANFVLFAIDWLYSIVPFPPLPPFPPFPGIAAATEAGPVTGAGRGTAAATVVTVPEAVTTDPPADTPANTPADTPAVAPADAPAGESSAVPEAATADGPAAEAAGSADGPTADPPATTAGVTSAAGQADSTDAPAPAPATADAADTPAPVPSRQGAQRRGSGSGEASQQQRRR